MQSLRQLRQSPRLDRHSVQPLVLALDSLLLPTLGERPEAEAGSLPRWLDTLALSDLPVIEQAVRRQIRWGWQYEEPALAPSRARRELAQYALTLRQLPSDALLTGLASFHGSGFVREAALHRLLDNRSGCEVPLLLLRCNDWVPAVARLAQDGLRQRLQPASAAHLLHSYALIEQLGRARRNSLSPLLSELRSLLLHPASWPLLRQSGEHRDKQVRRAACLLLAEAVWAQPAPLCERDLRDHLLQVMRSPDLWLRLWAARTARARLYGKALSDVLAPAQRDRSAPVRREAVLAFLDDFPELRRGLLDPCAGLRAMVRFYLRKKANLDLAAVYRHELNEAWQADCERPSATTLRRICVALDGLGETGAGEPSQSLAAPPAVTARDWQPGPPEAEILFYDRRPRIRRAALRLLLRLDRSHGQETSLAALRTALGDSAPGVVRCAVEILHSEAGSQALTRLGAEAIWQAFESRPEPGARRRLLRVLSQFGRWTRLGYLLRACQDPDAQVALLARTAAESALAGQVYTGPTSSERSRIEETLPALQRDTETRSLSSRVRSALAMFG